MATRPRDRTGGMASGPSRALIGARSRTSKSTYSSLSRTRSSSRSGGALRARMRGRCSEWLRPAGAPPLPGHTLHRVEGGLLKESWVQADTLELLRQLGASRLPG